MLTYINLSISRTRFPSCTHVTKQLLQNCVYLCAWSGLYARNNSQRIHLGPVSPSIYSRVLQKLAFVSLLSPTHLKGWSVFEIWVPFENDRKALCHRHKGTLYTFQGEIPVYCCWRIFENVTIVDALSRENISPKDACFHFKVLAASCFFNPCEWGFTISLSFSFYFFFLEEKVT